MGLLGDLALGIAGMALEALIGDDDNNSNSKSSSSKPYAILFETNWPYSAIDLRMQFLNKLCFEIGRIFVEIYDGLDYDSDFNMDESADGRFISDIVVTNGKTTVCYGMFGMAQCALSVSGENAEIVSKQLQSTLKEMDCWRAEITREEIPFHNKNWMKNTLDSLCHRVSDSDEDEENDLSEETLMLISTFLGGDGSKITDTEVKIISALLEGRFKREFPEKQVKSEMTEYIEEFKKSSYKMLTENIVDEYDDDDVFQELYYNIFYIAYLVITELGRFSKFSAEFIIKAKRILKVDDDAMEEIIAIISKNENISEHDLQKFYEQMKFCANDSSSLKKKQLIANEYWGKRQLVQYTRRRDKKSIDFFTTIIEPSVSQENGNFTMPLEELIEELKAAAEDGVSFAQCALGNRYFSGNGVEKNVDKTFELMTLAAEQNDFKAYFPLGVCYEKGFGTEVDEEKAIALFKKASDAGDAEAQKHLGYLYENGKLVSKNNKSAFQYYSLAAGQWDVEAMFHLGVCYCEGKGCAKNEKQGLSFIKLAAKENVKEAIAYLDMRNTEQIKKQESVKKAQTVPKQKETQATNTQKTISVRQDDKKELVQMPSKASSEKTETKVTQVSSDKSPAQVEQKSANAEKATPQKNNWHLAVSKEEVNKLLAEFATKHPDLKSRFILAETNPKKLQNALSAYAHLEQGEEAVILYDDTVFEGGKDGFVITNKNIYIHNSFSETKKVALGDISIVRLNKMDAIFQTPVPVHAGMAAVGSDDGRNAIFALLKEIIPLALKSVTTKPAVSTEESPTQVEQKSANAESSDTPKVAPVPQEIAKQESEKQEVVTKQVSDTKSWLLKIPLAEIEAKYVAEKQAGKSRVSPFTDNLYFAKLSPKKVNGTRSYAPLAADETPVLVYDDTVFGSAKDGFLITDKAVYIHEAFGESHTIPLEKLYSFELKTGLLGGVGKLMLNGTSMAVTVVTGGERKKLFAFLQEVIKV